MSGATTVHISNCVITVTHRINLKILTGKKDKFNLTIDAIKEELKKKWEDPDFTFQCCKVKFKFSYVNASGDDVDTKNLHEQNGISNQHKLGPKKSDGEWFLGDPDIVKVAPHEVGHELGMTDKYQCHDANGNTVDCYQRDPQGNPIANNPASTGVRPSIPGYDGIAFDVRKSVKQVDIDEIMSALKVKCPAKCCEQEQ